jgi:hypothetical protein
MRDNRKKKLRIIFSIIAVGAFASCSDDSEKVDGGDQTGELKKAIEDLAKELRELGAKQLESQSNIINKLSSEEASMNKDIQKLIGEEQKDNEGVHEMLDFLKKAKEDVKVQEKEREEMAEKIRLKAEKLKEKRTILMQELFSTHYSGLLFYMKVDPKPGIGPDQELAAKTALKESLDGYIDSILKDSIFLRSAEAYLDKNASLAEMADFMRLQYCYKSGTALTTPCLGLAVTGSPITDPQYQAALKLFQSHRSAIMCYFNIIYLTITQAKLENGLSGQRN